jgi:DNA-binding MarR family transcriptional regulator
MSDTVPSSTFRRPASTRRRGAAVAPAPEELGPLDMAFLENLVGYNARRAALAVIAVFLREMAPFHLRIVDFSVLTLIAHNPGVTSRQLCAALDILPPNLVGMIRQMETQGWIERRQHPTDRRAQGLFLTPAGQTLQAQAEAKVASLESPDITHLTPKERDTLIGLLRKVYRPTAD